MQQFCLQIRRMEFSERRMLGNDPDEWNVYLMSIPLTNRLSVRATIGSQVRLRSHRGHLLEPAESPGPTFQRGQKAIGPVLDVVV